MKIRLLALLVSIVLAGCAARGKDGMPDGYTTIHPGEFDWRAMSPEGVLLGTRGFGLNQKGDLSFWAGVVRKELENDKGYRFLTNEPIADENLPGRKMTFEDPRNPERICHVWVFLGKTGVH